MRKKIIVSALVGILLIGIVSASFLIYFGKITGSVEVEGPVFYFDGTELETDVYNLTINIIPSNEEDINITEEREVVFITESLEIDEFYNATFNIHIWAKKNNETSYLIFEIVKIDDELNIENICGPESINVTTSTFRERDEFSCSSEDIIFDPEDKIGVLITGMAEIRVGHKYTAGYPRIEVSAT